MVLVIFKVYTEQGTFERFETRFGRFLLIPDPWSDMSSVYTVPAARVFGQQASNNAEVVCSLWGKFDGTATFLSVIVAVIGDSQQEGRLKLVSVDSTGNLVDDDSGYYVIKTFLHGTRPVNYDVYDSSIPDAQQSQHKWTAAAAMTTTWGSSLQAKNVQERIEGSILAAVQNVHDQPFIDAIRACRDGEDNFRPVMLEFSMRGELIVDKRLRGAFKILTSLKAQKKSASYPSTGPAFIFWIAFDHWREQYIDVNYRRYCLKATFEEFSINGEHQTYFALSNFEQGRKVLEQLPVFSFLDKQHRMQYGPAILYKTESCSGESTSHPHNRETFNLRRVVQKKDWDRYKKNLWDLTAVCRQELNLEGFVLCVQRAQGSDPLFFKCKQYTLVSLPKSWAVQPQTFIKQKFDQISAAKGLEEHSSYLNELWDCVDYSHSKEGLQKVSYEEKTTHYEDSEGHLSAMITISDEGRTVAMRDWVHTRENIPLSSSLALLSMLPDQGASIWAIEYPLTGTVHVCGQAYFLTTTSEASIMKSHMLNAIGEQHNKRPEWIDHSQEGEFNPTRSISAVNATKMLQYATHQKQYCDHRKNRREIQTTLRYATAMHCFFVFLMSGKYERIVDKIIKYWPTMSALMRRMLVEILMTSNRGQTVATHEDYHPFRSVLTNKIFECTQLHKSTDSKVTEVMKWFKGQSESSDHAQKEVLKKCFAYFDEKCLEAQLSRTFSLINHDASVLNTQDVLRHLLDGFESVLPNNWHCFDARDLTAHHFFHDVCQHLSVDQAKLNAQTLTSTINTFCSFWNYNNAALGPFPVEQQAEFLQSYVYDLRKQINDSVAILRRVGLVKTMHFGTQRSRQNHSRFGDIPADVQIKDYRPPIVYKLKILTNLYSRKKRRPHAVFYDQL